MKKSIQSWRREIIGFLKKARKVTQFKEEIATTNTQGKLKILISGKTKVKFSFH